MFVAAALTPAASGAIVERIGAVFANGGTSLVIHAKADDMKSDPAGNAGDRIGCGVVALPVK